MLKDNAMYLKQEEPYMETNDVNLTSKDMEVNFSNKQDDEDDVEVKMSPSEMGFLGIGSEKEFLK